MSVCWSDARRVPKERPNATRLLQHPFLAGVGHKAAPPHGGLTLNTAIPPRVSPWEASSLAICGRPVLMLLTADRALGDITPKSQGRHAEYNWRDKTCPTRTRLITSWKALLLLLFFTWPCYQVSPMLGCSWRAGMACPTEYVQIAKERQDLSHSCLAHHELESEFIIIIIVIIFTMV